MIPLPREVLHLLITFLVKSEFNQLFKFRTICREWKDIGDHSSIWLECPLTITAPLKYLSPISSVFSFHPKTIILNIDQDIPRIDRNWRVIEFVVDQSINPLHTSRVEQAFQISSKFLKKWQYFHQTWTKFCITYEWLQGVSEIVDTCIRYGLYCSILNCVLLAIAAYFLSTISNYSTSLSGREIIGFCCLYWYVVYWLTLYLLSSVVQASIDYIVYSPSVCIHQPYRSLLKPSFILKHYIILYPLALIASFALLQSALSSSNSLIRYSYIIIPFICVTIMSGIAIFFEAKWREGFSLSRRSNAQCGILVSLIPIPIYLTVFLIGLYYDQSSHAGMKSLGYAFIPLFPYILLLLIAVLARVMKTIQLWKNFIEGNAILYSSSPPTMRQISLRLLANFGQTFSLILIFLLLFNLIYQAFLQSLHLSTSLRTVVIILLFLPILILSISYDNDHALTERRQQTH